MVNRNDNVLIVSLLESLNGNTLGFLDDSSIQMVLGQDFINWWKDDSLNIWASQHRTYQSLLGKRKSDLTEYTHKIRYNIFQFESSSNECLLT